MELLKTSLLLSCFLGAFAAPFSSTRQCSRERFICNTENSRYEVGKKYIYTYDALTKTLISGTSEKTSSLKFSCKADIEVISPCEITLTVREVESKESDAYGDLVTATNQGSLSAELEAHVLRFAFHDGVVTDVCPAPEEKPWALNFKRGILSAIQAPITEVVPAESPVLTTETDVTGKCPVKVMRSASSGAIMKVKDFRKCEHRTECESGIKTTMLTPSAPLFNILDSTQECEVAFQSNIVSESLCQEQHLSKAFSSQKAGATTNVTVSIVLIHTMEASAPANTFIHRQTSILYEHEETNTETERQVITKVKEVLGSIERKIGQSPTIDKPNLFSDLVTEMRKIQTLAGMTEIRQFAEQRSESLIKIFKDALPMCQTTPSIETMVTIINEVKASSDEEAKKTFKSTEALWLTIPAAIVHPKKEMISAWMPLIKTLSTEDAVFFLPISSLINQYCTSENPSCLLETEVQEALEYFQHLLGFDCVPSDEVPAFKMLMALKALTNARRLSTDTKIHVINNCFDHQDSNKGSEIRVAALELVRNLPCKPQYFVIAKNMYKNQHFDSELRIAAYRAIINCPSEDVMETVKEVLAEEASHQVGSYVWSHLSNLNETRDPQKQHLKKWVVKSGITTKSFKKLDLRKLSRNVEFSYYNDEMASGVTLEGDMMFSSKSFLPRQLKFNNTVSIFGYAVNLFEIGGRLEGVHQILESFFGPRGFFAEHSTEDLIKDYMQQQQEKFLNSLPTAEEEMPEGLPEGITPTMYKQLMRLLQFQRKMFGKVPLPIPGDPMPDIMPEGMTQELYDELLVYFMREGIPGDRKKRHLIREASLNDLNSQYHGPVEDSPQASMYMKMFGNELAYLDVAKIKTRLSEMKTGINPMKMLMSLAEESTHQLSSDTLIMDGSWTIPTVAGLPLKLAINGTVSMGIRTEGKIDMRGILIAPRSFEINGVFEPSAALEVSTSMEVMARKTRSGLNCVSRMLSSISLGGKIQVTDGKAFVLEVNVPDQKQRIIDVSSNIYLRTQGEALQLPGIPERFEKSYCSGSVTTKYIGSQLCAEIAFPKSYTKASYPRYPLTGPAHMFVTLEKTDPSLTMWKLEGSYALEQETVKGANVIFDRFHLMFGAPNTDIPRTFQVDVSYNRNDKEVDFNIVTPIKMVDIQGKLTNNEMLRKLEVSVTLDKTNVYTLDTEVESRPTVVDGDPVVNFYPRMDINSPLGLVLKYRSSISVRDGQQSHVSLWMSLDSPRTALVTVSGDVSKTESSRKVRYSTDLEITGRYVNVNVSGAWQKQKRDNIITIDATVTRQENGNIVKDAVINAKYTNRTTEEQQEWDLKTEWMFPRYPLLNFLLETDYVGTPRSSQADSKFCYRYNGEVCGQNTKVVMSHLLTWESTESTASENLNFKLRNSANNINFEIQQYVVHNSTHLVDFSFTMLNNTAEMEILNAEIHTRDLSEETAIKGDFEASIRSQTWRYGILEDWEFIESGRKLLKTSVFWEDQQAVYTLNYIPTVNEETGLKRFDFNSHLTYPHGSLTANWYAWKQGYNVSHGASASLIDQSLFAYQLDFINRTTEDEHDVTLDASFNITRPVSPISVTVHASRKRKAVMGSVNILRGDAKTFTSELSYLEVIGEDLYPKQITKMVIDVEIPEKDISLAISYMSSMSRSKSSMERFVRWDNRQIFYERTVTADTIDEFGSRSIFFDTMVNISYPSAEYDLRTVFNGAEGNYDYQVVLLRAKSPIVFFKVSYDDNIQEVKEKDAKISLLPEIRHREVRMICRTPLFIMRDVEWNTTLDTSSATFNFDSRLLYFPNQERPFVVTIDFNDKSNKLVSHNEVTAIFETHKRRVRFFNMAKYDVSSGLIQGSAAVEFGIHGSKPSKYDLSIDYSNKTEDETIFKQVTMIFNSPDNTFEAQGSLSYIEQTQYTVTSSILVSEDSIFGLSVTVTNNSVSSVKSFDVETLMSFLELQYRIHTVHGQDADSFNTDVKIYRNEEKNPMAEMDVAYIRAAEVHTVTVTLNSEDFDPLAINTVYTNRTSNQNIAVDVSTVSDKHINFVLDITSGSTETEREAYDVVFEVDNTYLPNRKFEVITHYGVGDNQLSVSSDLKISRVHLMNFMYFNEQTSPSASHLRENSGLQFTFPEIPADYQALSKLGLRYETEFQQDVMEKRKVDFRWGQLTDDESASLTLTTRHNQWEVRATHQMELPPLPKDMTFVLRNDTDPNAVRSFELQVNNPNDVSLMALTGSYSHIAENENHCRTVLTFSRHEHSDIQMVLETARKQANTVFGSTFFIKYSEDINRLMKVMIEVINSTSDSDFGFDVNTRLQHLVSGLNLTSALSIVNNNKKTSAGIGGNLVVADRLRPFNFEFEWNKEQKKYTLTSQTPWRKKVLSGQYEDRSYADYKIFRVTLTSTDNDDVTRSRFDYSSQQKEFSYIVNYNPDNPDDFMRFRAGYLNETAFLALLDSQIDGQYKENAKLLVGLDAPRVLRTHIEWDPDRAQYVPEYYENQQKQMLENYRTRMLDLNASREALRERFQASWDNFLNSNSDLTDTWNDMKERFLEKYEERKSSYVAMVEDYETRARDYWEQLVEDLELQDTLDKLKAKLEALAKEIKDVGDGYIETTSHRTKAAYNAHFKPIFEELKELIDSLKDQHRIQTYALWTSVSTAESSFYSVEESKAADPPNYKVGNGEDAEGANLIVETAVNVPGESLILDKPKDQLKTRWQKFKQLAIWMDLERFWNETRAEFEVIFGELGEEFKQSTFYADMMDRWEEFQEQIPFQEWRQQAEAKIQDIRDSDEMQDLIEVFQQLKEEFIVSSNTSKAGLIQIRDRIPDSWRNYTWDSLDYFKRPIYELIRKDLENGEILFLLYLPFDIHSLQSPPESIRRVEVLQRVRDMIADVREHTRNTLGEITLMDGTQRSMYDLMLQEPVLLYKEGNFSDWMQAEWTKALRKFWKGVHFAKLYLNPGNWIPPFQAHGVIVGNDHYVTFDRTFYDFNGDCSYLLAHDFVDGNFTVVVEYPRESVGGQKSIVLYLNSTTSFEIKSDFTVYQDKQFRELPLQHGRTTITRQLNSIRIHNTNGITITCDVNYNICNVNISGWYFGKTAGLLGTYNYDPQDDFTTSDQDMARHIDDFVRSWKVGKHCPGSVVDQLPECNSDPQVEANSFCYAHFLDKKSSLTQCIGVVDPAPYYSMCSSKTCSLPKNDRQDAACQSAKAYVDECNRLGVDIVMPSSCIKCNSPEGEFSAEETKRIQGDAVPRSADVVLIVEGKLCNSDMSAQITDIVEMLDSELKATRGFADNRFGLLGFGGTEIHNLPHIHTIDGQIFNEKHPLIHQGLPELQFALDGSNNTFAAILEAANYPFRAGVTKNIILLSCSKCNSIYHTDEYVSVASFLKRQGIQFNILMNNPLKLVATRAKNSSPKSQIIYGLDNRTAFTNKALSSGSFIGDKSLRKLVNEPMNPCALLAYETGGALFDSSKIEEKKFLDVLTQRMVQHTVVEPCQSCTCQADKDGKGRSFCGPCDVVDYPLWLLEMEQRTAELGYYSQLGMQTILDYVKSPETSTETVDNSSPKKLP